MLGAAAVVLNPTTGAIEAMYSNPTFDPNPLVSQNPTIERLAWNSYLDTNRGTRSEPAPTTRSTPRDRASRS